MSTEQSRLLETVADMAYAAGAAGWYSGDSRADRHALISWAEEFERTRVPDPDNAGEYLYAVRPGAAERAEYMSAVDTWIAAQLADVAGQYAPGYVPDGEG